MHKSAMNRRQLLNAMGLGASTLFLPSLMGDRQAYAQGPTKRLFVYYSQHGPVYQNWTLRRPGLPDKDGDWEIDLVNLPEAEWPRILRPLYPYRRHVLVVEGLGLLSGIAEPTRTNNHNIGTSHALTGAKMGAGGYGGDGKVGDTSIDQYVADAIAVPGRIPSLYLSNGYTWNPVARGTTELSPQKDPSALFARLFPNGGAPVTNNSDGPKTPDEFVSLGRGGVLASVQAEYKALAGKLGGEDRKKLEDHLALVSDLEKQFGARGNISCAAPAHPGVDPNARLKRWEQFVPLMTAAMACDLTRVITFAKAQWNPSEFGGSGGDTHQDLAHGAKPGNSAAMEGMTKYYELEARHLAQMVGSLEKIPEAGKTLLDQTCVLWACELANGPHDLYRNMFVLVGSAGGHFKTGRYLKYAENVPNPAPSSAYGLGDNTVGPPHSKLLISVMQAMGVQRNALPIQKVTARDWTGRGGSVIDFTGPLPRLTA